MKTLKRVLSVVLALTMLMSMMTLTVLAENTATIDVTYYTDAAMGTVATKVAPGESVYAKLTLNLPQATFKSMNVNVTATNATLAAEADGNLWDAVLNSEMAGRLERATGLPGQNELGNFAISKVLDASKPWDSEWDQNANIGSATVPMVLYKLDVADGATGNVSVAVTGNLDIGYYDEGDDANYPTPFTVNANSLPIESSAQEPVITYSYDATIASTKVDPESATYEDDVKALVTVTKTTLSDGTATGTEEASAKSMTVNKAAKTVTVVFPDDTQKTLNYTEMAISYGTPVVTLDSEFDFAKTDAEIAAEVVVTVVKTKDDVPTELTLAAGTDYDVDVTFATDANEGSAVVTFKGDYAANDEVEKTFARTNAPVSYKDVVASISGSPFAYNVTEENIKAAIAVKGTKVEGVVETANATVPTEAYEITVDLDAKTATVAMLDGTAVQNAGLTFEISDEPFTVDGFTVNYSGDAEYDYTTTVDFTNLVTVTATKTFDGGSTEPIDVTNDVIVTVDKDTDTITVTWKDSSAYVGEEIAGAVFTVTFNDVITYQNANATMNKTSFAEGTSEADILAEVVVTLEKLVNGTKDDTFVPAKDVDYTLSYADNKVTVDFTDATLTDKEFDITFGTVTLKVEAATNVTEGVVDISGAGAATEFTAVVKVEGLDTRVMTGAELAISASNGELKSVAVVAGSNYNILGTPAIENNVWTGEINKATGDANLANGLLVVTVDAADVEDGEKIVVKVDSATLNMIDLSDLDNPYVTIPNTTEALEVTVKAFERNVEDVTVDAFEIGIVTLGPVTDAKFVNGVSIEGIDLTDKVTLNSTTRKIMIDELTLPVSATENEVKYTLKVEVAGYTTIEEEIVVSYNGGDEPTDATNNWSVTNPITADSAIYAGNVNTINAIEADDYTTIIQAYGEAAAYDIYEGGATIDLNDIMTTVYMIDTYGMTNINSAGIIE